MSFLRENNDSCEELTHWKRLWCWEGLGAGGEGDDRGWDGWMVSPTRWTWVWVNSGSWWWTERPGVLQFMGSQRVGHNWATELNWTELKGDGYLLVDLLYDCKSVFSFDFITMLKDSYYYNAIHPGSQNISSHSTTFYSNFLYKF